MATDIQKAILQAKIEGILKKIIVKTNADNVMYDDSTTLTAKLAEILASLDKKAEASAVTTEIQQKIDAAVNGLIDGAPDTYNTLKEIADYISQHEEAKEALQKAIGDKLDKTTFQTFQNSVEKLGALAGKDKVAESDLDAELAEKVNAASEGSHSHANKSVLDGITGEKVTSWDGAAEKAHEHENSSTLDEITGEKVTSWDDAASKAHEHENSDVLDEITREKLTALEGKSKIYFSKEQPEDLKEGDLWFQLIDEE